MARKKIKRPDKTTWRRVIRPSVWARDRGQCQGPYCKGKGPIELKSCHIDHILPLCRGGNNELSNLRVLCYRCHVLRSGHEHQGMIASALAAGILEPDWRQWVWDN